MKSILFIFYLVVFSTASFAQRVCALPDHELTESSKQIVEFIFKLDSLNYHSGKVDFNELERGKAKATYKQLTDSVYSVRLKGCTYLLNTKSGKLTDPKNGRIIYRNTRLRILESERTVTHGTDALGTYTAYFGNFRKEIPSRIVYDSQPVTPDKTIQYQISCTPMVNDSDSSWVEKDTTRITRQYENGKLISERTESMSVYHFPEIVEFHYSNSGDTTIQVLTHFEDGFGGNHPRGYYVTSSPYKLIKRFAHSEKNSIRLYEYNESDTGKSERITNSKWESKNRSAYFHKQTHTLITYESGENVYKTQSVEFRFSGKK